VSQVFLKEKLQGFLWQSLTAICLLVFGIIGYILLQTVAKPYYIENEAYIGDQVALTYLVLNPCPWKTREPRLQVPLDFEDKVVGESPGMVHEPEGDHLVIYSHGGLPPGCVYYVSFQYAKSSGLRPKTYVMCDSKPCKKDPSFDMDLILKVHEGAVIIFAGVSLLCIVALVSLRAEVIREKDHTLRQAAQALMGRVQSYDEIFNTTAMTVQNLASLMYQDIKSKPVTPQKKPSK